MDSGLFFDYDAEVGQLWNKMAYLSYFLFCQVLRGWLSVSPNYDEVIQW